MIITLSGPDGSGKTTIAELLEQKLNSPEISTELDKKFTLVNTDMCAPNKFPTDHDEEKFFGFNLAMAQMYNAFDNFIRDRGALDDLVYSKKFNRVNALRNWRYIDNAGIDKNILVLIIPSYTRYLMNVKHRNEKTFSKDEYGHECELFMESFNESNVLFKYIVNVSEHDSIHDVLNGVFMYVFPVLLYLCGPQSQFENKCRELFPKFPEKYHGTAMLHHCKFHNCDPLLRFKFFNLMILKCRRCSKMISSCSEINPEYCRPILPKICAPTLLDVEYLFVGIAPGRGKNEPYSIECFSHSSGNYLSKLITDLKMEYKCAITNVIKCNTPTDKSLFDMQSDIPKCCTTNFLLAELKWLYPNLKKIIVLGMEAKKLIISTISDNLSKDHTSYLSPKNKSIDIIYVKHPSYLNYSKFGEYSNWYNVVETQCKLTK